MEQGRVIIITGPPGTGKTAVASLAAKSSDLTKSVHLSHFCVSQMKQAYSLDVLDNQTDFLDRVWAAWCDGG